MHSTLIWISRLNNFNNTLENNSGLFFYETATIMQLPIGPTQTYPESAVQARAIRRQRERSPAVTSLFAVDVS